LQTVSITGLRKSYGKFAALKGIDLSLEPGLFGLLGPNGAGKTTLMKILSTLLAYDDGDVRIHGLDVKTQGHEIRGLLGVLPQHFHAPGQFTGEEFLQYVASMKDIRDKSEVERVLHEVNLTDKAKKKIKSYSGGMKRRLGIAQALIGDPKLIIVDEPTAGLDPAERIRFRNLMARLSADRTILLSTHIVSDIESSCEKAAVLFEGELRFHGTLPELQARANGSVYELRVPAHLYDEVDRDHVVINSRKEGNDLVFRLLAPEAPQPEAVQVEPNLEDGYMAVLRGVTAHG
jgi:ABC-2 type transport system ATP-binding protein